MRRWTLKHHGTNVHELRMNTPEKGESQRVLWISDLHWDNPHTDLGLLRRHLDEAVEYDAPIIVVGDFFCAMQGKYDKRASKDDLREEHRSGNYLDKLVDTATEWFMPYRNNLAIIGQGNHDTAILKYHETDLIDRLTYNLRSGGGICQKSGYGFWVRFSFTRFKTMRGSFNAYCHHGFGGGGPVTRGAIDWSRYLMQADADVYVAGHLHRRNTDELVRAYLTNQCVVRTKQTDFVRCSTYKEEFGSGESGFHVEKGRGPRPIGGWWMSLERPHDKKEAVPLRKWWRTM